VGNSVPSASAVFHWFSASAMLLLKSFAVEMAPTSSGPFFFSSSSTSELATDRTLVTSAARFAALALENCSAF